MHTTSIIAAFTLVTSVIHAAPIPEAEAEVEIQTPHGGPHLDKRDNEILDPPPPWGGDRLYKRDNEILDPPPPWGGDRLYKRDNEQNHPRPGGGNLHYDSEE
ncbi:unnamed protein product [Ambrosiozyma monospora]|uniref:Unnamed protein product n=1 Tax=Ambrosiozyma monospora TaxID=43982 RepID=A0A9W6Z299_AMBMO|nr:unnamed protein product [Ambrosiozyma monospora]